MHHQSSGIKGNATPPMVRQKTCENHRYKQTLRHGSYDHQDVQTQILPSGCADSDPGNLSRDARFGLCRNRSSFIPRPKSKRPKSTFQDENINGIDLWAHSVQTPSVRASKEYTPTGSLPVLIVPTGSVGAHVQTSAHAQIGSVHSLTGKSET
eukprot:CAMPEP_0113845970 /NCGR_PEP_ID=MMETSP0372-20130328/1046_1 /TAXON_ID=340204 /ORGANISM="Lankesteria abbotti" /LENGTH=152 /DNA_ID=CAMNT_0000815059 /DNA_START=12 /DNA_END=471 /DNA_ORIENTATION=- /assembly_acc=CAM_ASM_000359